jgi:Tfp pilus assembly protein PilX
MKSMRSLVRSESGQSLLLALIFMSALTITIGAVVSFTTSNETSFGRDRQATRAFQTAEAGLSDAIAVITNSSFDGSDTQGIGSNFTKSIPTDTDGATGTYSATKYAASDSHCTPADGQSQNPCWVITSTATSSDGKVTRSVQQTYYYNQTVKDVSNVYSYGLYVDNGNNCVFTHGSPDITVDNVFIAGCYSPVGTAVIRPSGPGVGSVYIGGLYTPTGNSTIGTSSDPYGNANMPGSCGATCGPSTGVYANSFGGPGPQTSRPEMDAPKLYKYGNSAGQPGDPTVVSWDSSKTPANGGVCSPANAFKLDNNNSADRSVTGATLMPSASTVWSCTVYLSNGNVLGSISSDGHGTIDIEGMLFVDGDLDVSNSGNYTGNGTIYVNGVVTGAGNIQICGPASGAGTLGVDHGCSTKWDPNVGMLGLAIINPLDNPTGFQRNGQGEIDATVIVNKGYSDVGGTVIAGSIIADGAEIGGSSGLVTTNGPPTMAPTTIVTTSGWTQQPNSWKQLK